jgi:hypothetical protein
MRESNQEDEQTQVLELKSLFWRNKFKNFIFNSDEKWILSQYNLLKLFLFQNSIEVDSPVEEPMAEPLQNDSIPQSLRERPLEESTRTSREDSKRLVKAEEIKLNLKSTKSGMWSPPILKKMTSENLSKKEGTVKVKVFDVWCMLDTFNEIDNISNMRKILYCETVNLENLSYLKDDVDANELEKKE